MTTRAEAMKAQEKSPAGVLDPGLTDGFLGPRVRVLWNLLSARMAEALAPFALHAGAFSALALISANPGCSQNELAQGLGMDKSAVVAIVDELEERGLARRVRSAQDRRRYDLTLTAEGETTMQRMYMPARTVGQPIREALSQREIQQLLSLLDRAHRALEEVADRS